MDRADLGVVGVRDLRGAHGVPGSAGEDIDWPAARVHGEVAGEESDHGGAGGVVGRADRHPVPLVCNRLRTSGPPHSAGEGYGCQTSLMVFTLPSPSSVMS